MTAASNMTSTTVSTQDPLFGLLVVFAVIGVATVAILVGQTWIHTANRLDDMEYEIHKLKEKIEK